MNVTYRPAFCGKGRSPGICHFRKGLRTLVLRSVLAVVAKLGAGLEGRSRTWPSSQRGASAGC